MISDKLLDAMRTIKRECKRYNGNSCIGCRLVLNGYYHGLCDFLIGNTPAEWHTEREDYE